jgi:hypothetical protein
MFALGANERGHSRVARRVEVQVYLDPTNRTHHIVPCHGLPQHTRQAHTHSFIRFLFVDGTRPLIRLFGCYSLTAR